MAWEAPPWFIALEREQRRETLHSDLKLLEPGGPDAPEIRPLDSGQRVNRSAAPRAEPQDHVMLLGSEAPDEIGLPSQLSSRADDFVPAIRAHDPSLCPPWFLLRHSHSRRLAKLRHRVHEHARTDGLG